MRVLLIKTSSMGDIIHTLPALTDAGKAIPDIRFDWVVETPFAEIPSWHPRVDRIIPVALRRWRKAIFARKTHQEWQALRHTFNAEHYDVVLDAQGLVKSAFLARFAKGVKVGLDWSSAREPLASLAYQRKSTVNFYQHAIVRMRQLFSQALQYPLPDTAPDFGLNRERLLTTSTEPYFVFLHGTTWATKLWPESYWRALAVLAGEAGYRVKVSGGNTEELERAKRLGQDLNHVDVLPRLSLIDMAALLANAKGAVAVDTGFGHLAGALDVPTVSIYGSTNPHYTGALGASSLHLATTFACSPCLKRQCTYQGAADVTPACYATVPPSLVFANLQRILKA